MKTKMLKNVVLSIVIVTVLICVGIKTIDEQSKVEQKQSSFSLTKFDYIVLSPSYEQVNMFKHNEDAVDSIFPCYNLEVAMTGKTSSTINILFSDMLEEYDTGLISKRTILSGEYDSNGIMLDKTAAIKLNVSVGDMVNFTLGSKSFSLKVAGIYLASTYRNLDKGIAIAKWSDTMKSSFSRTIQYDLAFIDANKNTQCASLLQDYKPMGRLISQEDYIASFKANNNRPVSMDEEDWNDSIIVAYNEYKNNFLSDTYPNSVQTKSNYMADVNDQVASTLNEINKTSVIIAIVATVFYSILSAVFIFTNNFNDGRKLNEGVPKQRIIAQVIWINICCTVTISIIVCITLLLVSKSKIASNYYADIIYLFGLPVLASLLLSIPLAIIRGNSLYQKIHFHELEQR